MQTKEEITVPHLAVVVRWSVSWLATPNMELVQEFIHTHLTLTVLRNIVWVSCDERDLSNQDHFHSPTTPEGRALVPCVDDIHDLL